MSAVKLDHVEAGFLCHLRCPDEIAEHPSHVLVRHLLWRRKRWTVCDLRRSESLPVSFFERQICSFPWKTSRSLSARVSELKTYLSIGPLVRESDNLFPRTQVCVVVHPRAPERDAGFRGNAHHLRHNERSAAKCAGSEMNEVEIVRSSILRAVHVHRRDDHSIVNCHPPQAKRSEHRRWRSGIGL